MQIVSCVQEFWIANENSVAHRFYFRLMEFKGIELHFVRSPLSYDKFQWIRYFVFSPLNFLFVVDTISNKTERKTKKKQIKRDEKQEDKNSTEEKFRKIPQKNREKLT